MKTFRTTILALGLTAVMGTGLLSSCDTNEYDSSLRPSAQVMVYPKSAESLAIQLDDAIRNMQELKKLKMTLTSCTLRKSIILEFQRIS